MLMLRKIGRTALAMLLTGAGSAIAQSPPEGVWLDHTGRGAVEIRPCGANLCGHIVWLEDKANTSLCGTKIIGDLRKTKSGTWDNGWIYDPERQSRFDVELTPLKSGKLRVLGYAGVKFLSETMIWQPAPADMQRCDGVKTGALSASMAKPERDEPSRSKPMQAGEPPLPSAPGDQVATANPVAPETGTAELPTPSRPKPAPARGKETCKLDLPYVSLSFPCPD